MLINGYVRWPSASPAAETCRTDSSDPPVSPMLSAYNSLHGRRLTVFQPRVGLAFPACLLVSVHWFARRVLN